MLIYVPQALDCCLKQLKWQPQPLVTLMALLWLGGRTGCFPEGSWQKQASVIIFWLTLCFSPFFYHSSRFLHYKEFGTSNLIWLICYLPKRRLLALVMCSFSQEIQHVMHPKLTQLLGHGKVVWCISVTEGSL